MLYLKKKINFILILIFYSSLLFSQQKHVIGTWRAGLFSGIFGVLNNIVWCQKNHKIPIVLWGPDSFYYNENGYFGSHNPWEYYFYPVSDAKYQIGDKIHNDWRAPDGSFLPLLSPNLSSNERQKINNLVNKYIKIKPHILSKVHNFYKKNMQSKRTVGLHLRGTDKYLEVPPVPLQILVNAAKRFSNYQILYSL